MQAVKYEFILNLKTARALGIDVPMAFSAAADESSNSYALRCDCSQPLVGTLKHPKRAGRRPLSGGEPDIQPTPPNDRVDAIPSAVPFCCDSETAGWINDVISYRLRI